MKRNTEKKAFEPDIVYSDMINVYNRKNSCVFFCDAKTDICFFGDSITEGWDLDSFFSGYGALRNRGIGGEKLMQGKTRFYYHVVQLSPKYCVFMEGINDISSFVSQGPSFSEESERNFMAQMREGYRAVVKEAKENSIVLALCSVMPLGVQDKRNQLVVQINDFLQTLCREENISYIDYYSAISDRNGLLMEVTNGDLIHPLGKGYKIMADTLENNFLRSIVGKGEKNSASPMNG